MWPWGHAAVAYLLYSGWRHATDRIPTTVPALAVVVGSQLPDLVDKPLAWTVNVLPNGRSLMHSAVTVTLLTIAIVWYARRHNRPEPFYAFALGIWAHLFADALPGF